MHLWTGTGLNFNPSSKHTVNNKGEAAMPAWATHLWPLLMEPIWLTWPTEPLLTWLAQLEVHQIHQAHQTFQLVWLKLFNGFLNKLTKKFLKTVQLNANKFSHKHHPTKQHHQSITPIKLCPLMLQMQLMQPMHLCPQIVHQLLQPKPIPQTHQPPLQTLPETSPQPPTPYLQVATWIQLTIAPFAVKTTLDNNHVSLSLNWTHGGTLLTC